MLSNVGQLSPVFLLLSAIAVAGALAAMALRNTVHCALALTVAFAGLALLYLKLGAEFAGFAQILVYIGAVAILVVFAILLTRGSETARGEIYSKSWVWGVVIAAAVFAVFGWAILSSASALPNAASAPKVSTAEIGNLLVTRYVLPLEIVAVLLTSSMIGAVIVAMYEKARPK